MLETGILLNEDHVIRLRKEAFTNFEKNTHVTGHYMASLLEKQCQKHRETGPSTMTLVISIKLLR